MLACSGVTNFASCMKTRLPVRRVLTEKIIKVEEEFIVWLLCYCIIK